MKPRRAESTARAQCRLHGRPRSIALPSFFAFPDPSLLVTSVVSSVKFLARVTGADCIGRVGIEEGVSDEGTASCACSPKQVLLLHFASRASCSQPRGFLLKSHRCRVGKKSGL